MEKKLPPKYDAKKIPLPENAGGGFAWDKATILDFLCDSSVFGFVILGGDVISTTYGRYNFANANWHVSKRNPTESFEDYAARARAIAKDYIEKYPQNQSVVFAPTLTSEVAAGLKFSPSEDLPKNGSIEEIYT
jgi:hypothetical protein